jgi:hypothetical protein
MIAFFCFIAAAFGIASAAPAYCLAPLAVLLGLYALCSACRSAFLRKDFDALIIQGVVFSAFLLCMLLKKESAAVYALFTQGSLQFSALVGAFIGRQVSMGPTYSGIDLVCLFLIAAAVDVVFDREKRPAVPLARLVGILLIWGLYIALWTVLAENSLSLGLGFLEPLTGPLDYRALLFALLLAAHLFARRKRVAPPARGKRQAGAAAILAAVSASLYLLSLIGPAAPAAPAGGRVLFWDSGLDFSLPEEGRYGLDNAGMFGFLPRYLETRGYLCTVTDLPDAAALNSADVLVIINPMFTPSAENLEAIRGFVERGGGLLAAGDHTGDAQIRLPLNAILAPAGISFNFDSAMPFKTLWADEFVRRRSPVFAGVSDKAIQIVVGASLELSGGAEPLLIGRCGYSDAGDPGNAADGFLGDRRFNRGERVGDLTLAASAAYGDGRIAAFGDTSFLQNVGIAYSYPLIDNLFARLAGGGGGNGPEGEGTAPGGAIPYSASCLIDAGHLNSFGLDKSGDAPDGFIAAVLRAGMTPCVSTGALPIEAMKQRGELRLVVLTEPAAALSASELRALTDFVEGGGALLLFGDYKSPEATRELFARFGFSFENMPIGRVAPETAPEMAFWNACPLLFDGNGGAESLIDIWGRSVAARRSLGAGTVCAFADSDFIKNKNLESVDAYRKGNVDFIGELLAEALRTGGEAIK